MQAFYDSHQLISFLILFVKIVFVFVSPYDTDNIEFGNHLVKHGDGVKDIAFEVEELDVIVKIAKERGATIVKDIWEESDEFGKVRFATLQTVRKSGFAILLPTQKFEYCVSSMATQLTRWLNAMVTRDSSYQASSSPSTKTTISSSFCRK